MKGDLTGVEPTLDSKSTREMAPERGRKNRRRTVPVSSSGGSLRFFMSKTDSDRLPTVDQELQTEAEAMLESLKTGKSYFVISEWKGVADLSKKVPQIRKESVTNKKATSL